MIPLFKNLITTVVAPHGITDLIHAAQHNRTTELVMLNGVTVIGSLVLSDTAPLLLDGAFIAASVVHFHHDMPEIKAVPTPVLSAALIAVSIVHFPSILMMYMVILHVPNHYRTNLPYIMKDAEKNVGFIILFTMVLFFGGQIFPWIYDNEFVFNGSKGLIISHIIYNERHIYNRASLTKN